MIHDRRSNLDRMQNGMLMYFRIHDDRDPIYSTLR